MGSTPQPSLDRMVPFAGHPVVVGVVPEQDPLVVRTAAALARALGVELYAAHADTARYVVAEHPDGSVDHAALDPDGADDGWRRTEAGLRASLADALRDEPLTWHLRYLAGRPDRALTHLARAVDASTLVVGTRAPGGGHRVRELLEGSVAAHLAHHQHRPVLTVPLAVVDWKELPAPWAR
ncbi:universal stress protein [Cellulomonas massiliensis]|uniref:universal stress protein n=1 Tax=Cellulomonas massiliensis TaxID=1465811 RepID=UPI0002ED0A29|nr:universal stress protein [Cellulomonas massiliensis]